MIKNVIKFVLLALFCAPMFAQTVTVTATVVDGDGQAWIGGSYSVSLILPPGNASFHSTVTGIAFPSTFQGGLDGTGSLSIALTPTNYIAPAGSKWQFKICPQVLNAGCGTITIPITASGSISSQINAAIPVPRITGGPGVYAYNDTEVSIFAPNQYFNVISQQNRCYSTSWGLCQSGGGTPGGSSTDVQSNQSGAFYGDSGLTYNSGTKTLTAGNLQMPSTGDLSWLTSGTQNVGFSNPSPGVLSLDTTSLGNRSGALNMGLLDAVTVTTPELNMFSSDTNLVTIIAAGTSTAYQLILPPVAPNGQYLYCLGTGGGVCEWSGGGIAPATQYQIPAYASGGTTLQGSNLTVDSTGNTLSVPGLINFPIDNSSNTSQLIGSGANVGNYIGFSGNRALFGYDGSQPYIAGGGLGVHLGGIGTTKIAGFNIAGMLQGFIGSSIASSGTITPASPIVHVTGTANVQNITVPNGCTTGSIGCSLTIIADAGFSTITGGNIQSASTLSPGSATVFVYDSVQSSWYLPPIVAGVPGSKLINGRSYSAYYSGSTLDVRVNACISDAEHLANGNTTGICDASGEIGTQVTAAQINVGTSAGLGVVLILPTGSNGAPALWLGGMTDGTSCTIKQYGDTSILGSSPASGIGTLMAMGASSTSNVKSIYCMGEVSNDGDYFYNSGYAIININANAVYPQGNVTADNIGAELSAGTFDASTWEHMVFFDELDTTVVNATELCCSTNMRGVSINASFYGTPLALGIGVSNFNLTDSSVVHPGPGLPVISFTDNTFHSATANLSGIYVETSNSDTSTAMFQINGYKAVNLHGITFTAGVEHMTASGVTTTNTYNTAVNISGMTFDNGSGDFVLPVAAAIVNNDTGKTVPTDAVGNIPFYSSDQTGTGGVVHATSPTLVTPALGTPASGVVTNLTGTGAFNTTGTAGGLTGTPTLPNGTKGVTQTTGDSSTDLATDAFVIANAGAGGSYPGAGIANSTGTAWGTSYTTSGSGTVVCLQTSCAMATPNIGVASGTSLTTGSTVQNSSGLQNTTSSNAQLTVGSGGPQALTSVAGNVALTVSNSNGSPTGDLEDWKANGVIVAKVNSAGVLSAAAALSSVYTVSTLPSASSLAAGTYVTVSDATTFTPGTCTGGGSDYMIAITNGTTWSCH